MTPEELQAANRRMDTTLAAFDLAVHNIMTVIGCERAQAEYIINEMHNPADPGGLMLMERLEIPRDDAWAIIGLSTDRPFHRLERLNAYFVKIGVTLPPVED